RRRSLCSIAAHSFWVISPPYPTSIERLYAVDVEERRRGEDGYREWSIHLIEMGICSCDGCGGHLDDGKCTACGCQHVLQGPTQHDRNVYPAWIPYYYAGRCRDADASRAEKRRHHE